VTNPAGGIVRENLRGFIISGTILGVVLIAAMTALSLAGKDATELRSLINTVMNAVSVILSGGAVVFARNAQANAQVAAEQTNGQLDPRFEQAVARVLAQRDRTAARGEQTYGTAGATGPWPTAGGSTPSTDPDPTRGISRPYTSPYNPAGPDRFA
jgi:hypothetical protein